MDTRRIARFGLLTAMALTLGYFERFIPVASAIPGIKLGLANTVLLYGVYLMDGKSTWLLMLAKVVLSGFLFSGLSGMLYSLAGGVLSLCAMLLLRKAKEIGIIGVSVGGAVFHNIGQITVACMVVQSRAVLSYLPVLMMSAIITGALTGVMAKYTIAALKRAGFGEDKGE
ncbi:MAG: Gx transporter family protein [Clostridia bacterium]|nr:Gx transporter family protein [Clostridia bacterium]